MRLTRVLFAWLLIAATPCALAGVPIEQWTAPSGARVLFVASRALPIVDVQVDFAAGSAFDPADKPGVAGTTHGLLDLGVEGLDENQLAERLADLGAKLAGGADSDRASVSLRSLSAADKLGPATDILRAVLTTPKFPAAVFEREKARAVAGLKEALTRPDTIASRAFWQALYPNHPYGRQSTPESLAAITRADVEAFYHRHYTADRAVVTVVGDLSRADAAALAARLTEGLPRSGDAATIPDAVPPAGGLQRIAHPALQAHLFVGMPALKRGDPDYFPLLVGNYVLGGGGFVSRLMREVREKRGYAYDVHSYFLPLKQTGPFQIGLQTKRAQAADALMVVNETLVAFMADGPSEEELEAAKANLIGGFPLKLDSNRKILDNVAMIGFYGLPLDYLDTWSERVGRVTVADIRAAFARHLHPENLVTVTVAAD